MHAISNDEELVALSLAFTGVNMEDAKTAKRVFVSYSRKDQDFAMELSVEIEARFGKHAVWIDLFDLTAGDELAPKVAGAIQNAKWFILLASKSSMDSRWVKYEANLATFLSIERDDFRIITVKLDDCVIPPPLDIELRRRKYVDVSKDRLKGINEVLDALSQATVTRSGFVHVFLDRGREADRLQLAAEGARVVYVVGIQGIGKTALVEEVARTKFGRPYIRIPLRPAHDLELLARQVISAAGQPQPEADATDDKLLETMIWAVGHTQQQTNAFLFLDDAENAMDEDGRLRPYLSNFVNRYVKSDLASPLIVVARRRPEVSVEAARDSQIVLVEWLPDEFILPCIQHWYASSTGKVLSLDADQTQSIVKHMGGHPLAARLIASYLIVESPASLLRKHFISDFKMRMAEYILSEILPHTSPLEQVILQAIAVAETGITVEDLMAIHTVRAHGVPNVQEAISGLAHKLLLSQEADFIKLHPFISNYFERRAQLEGNFKTIAADLANHAFRKAMSAMSSLDAMPEETRESANQQFVSLNQQLIRYAVSAHRLLLIAGDKDRAKQIPFRLWGHIRELVLVAYQRFSDYELSLEYANQWLEIEPDDTDIALYRARSLRRLGRYKEAERFLGALSYLPDRLTRAKVDRELGLIARDNNDLRLAIQHFRSASITTQDGSPVYALSFADLASTLIANAEGRGGHAPESRQAYEEAISLLDKARNYLPRFDEVHLSAYVDALVHLDRNTEAVRMVEDALVTSPNDPHLNLKKADLLLKTPRLDDAMTCARTALDGGLELAHLTMANILFERKHFAEALQQVKSYRPKNPRDKLFAGTICAKILTALAKYDEARTLLAALVRFDDTYVQRARVINETKAAESALYGRRYDEARRLVGGAEALLDEATRAFPARQAFADLQQPIERLRGILAAL